MILIPQNLLNPTQDVVGKPIVSKPVTQFNTKAGGYAEVADDGTGVAAAVSWRYTLDCNLIGALPPQPTFFSKWDQNNLPNTPSGVWAFEWDALNRIKVSLLNSSGNLSNFSTTPISLGIHDICFTFNENELKFYLDTVLTDTFTFGSTLSLNTTFNNTPIYIGQKSNGGKVNSCAISDIKIYHTELQQADL